MAWSKTQPAQVGDALPSAYGTTEEKGIGRMGRTDLGLGETEERIPITNGFRQRGRDVAAGVQKENITHVPTASIASNVDR
jgi:hypothetical protein